MQSSDSPWGEALPQQTAPAARTVVVKTSWHEVGVGTEEATPLWESTPTEEGAIVRLDRTNDGTCYMSFTDAEEFDGAYVSVRLTDEDLQRLYYDWCLETST